MVFLAFIDNWLYGSCAQVCLITCHTFHAHKCCLTYPRTFTRDADVSEKNGNFIRSKSALFAIFHEQ